MEGVKWLFSQVNGGGAGRTQKVNPLKWELEELHEGSSSGDGGKQDSVCESSLGRIWSVQSPSQEAGKKEPLPLAPAKAFDGGET